MRVVHWMSTRNYEVELAAAVAQGAQRHGDTYEQRLISAWSPGTDTGDLMVLVGLHFARKALAEDSAELGRRILHLDKGITRGPALNGEPKSEYWRMSLDEHQPERLLRRLPKLPGDRRRRFEWEAPERWVEPTRDLNVLVCPPGRRECLWYGLGDHVEYSAFMVRIAEKRYPDNDLLFRPKPRHVAQHQWEEPPWPAAWDNTKRPIEGALRFCRVMYAYSTSATLNAVLAGVPIHTLGPNCMAALEIDPGTLRPMKSQVEVERHLNKLGYLQWSWEEWRNGTAWDFVKNVALNA